MNSYLFGLNCKNVKFSLLISLFCLLNLLLIFPDYNQIYIDNFYVSGNDEGDGFYLKFSTVIRIFQIIDTHHRTIIFVLLSLYFFSLLSIILNFYKFLFSVTALLLHTMMVNSSSLFSYGADFFINFALFINVFFSYSGKGNAILHSFAQRLTQVHLCITYFFAGLGKLFGVDWINGGAFWKISNLYFVEYLQFKDLPSPVYLFSGLFVVVVQVSYPIFINIQYTRKYTLFSITIVHSMIAVAMQFYTFGGIMILLNYVAWGNYVNINYDFGHFFRKYLNNN